MEKEQLEKIIQDFRLIILDLEQEIKRKDGIISAQKQALLDLSPERIN